MTDARAEVALTIANGEGVDIWDMKSGAILKSFDAKIKSDKHVLISQGAYIICSSSEKQNIEMRSIRTTQIRMKCVIPEALTSLAVSPDGDFIAGGSATGKLYIWQTSTGYLIRSFKAHFKGINSLQFTLDSISLISGGLDALVRCWILTDLFIDFPNVPVPQVSWSQHSLAITDIIIGLPGITGTIFTCSLDHTVKCWDLPSKQMLCSFRFPTFLTCMCIDPAETFLIVGGGDGNIYMVSLLEQQNDTIESKIIPFIKHRSEITSISLSMNGSILYSSDNTGQCYVWDVSTQQVLTTMTKKRKKCNSVRIITEPRGLLPSGLEAKQQDSLAGQQSKMPQPLLQSTPITTLPQYIDIAPKNTLPSNIIVPPSTNISNNTSVGKKRARELLDALIVE